MKNLGRIIRNLFTSVTVFLFILFASQSSYSQGLRVGATAQVFGDINGAFIGPTVGIEAILGKRFTLVSDVSMAFHQVGDHTFSVRPDIRYYFSKTHNGFFIGPSLEYTRMTFDFKEYNYKYTTNLYSAGFTLGVKADLNHSMGLEFGIHPHVTTGPLTFGAIPSIKGQIALSFKL